MRALAFCAGPAALVGIAPPVPTMALPPAALWLAIGRRALQADDAEGALRAFDGALAHEPRLAVAHLSRAVCLTAMGREEEAQDALEATLGQAAGQEEVLYALARMCAREGQAAFAMPLLSEALRAKPALLQDARADPLFADHPALLAVASTL